MSTSKLTKVHTGHTTPVVDTKPLVVKVDPRPIRLAENKEYLNNSNVKAFLGTIAWAEGGGYDFLFGASPSNTKWRFTDYSTHPGPGSDKVTTAAGMYQIKKSAWEDHGIRRMGLTDFSPQTQDLIAVSLLRKGGAVDALISCDFKKVMSEASYSWAALAQGPGLPNRYSGQPYKEYEAVLAKYKELGGTAK